MINRLTGMLDFQAKALELRSERQRLIASNIANADTPGYVARDFDFPRALLEATRGASSGFKLAENAEVGAGGWAAGGERDPRLSYATAAQTNLDRNSVDMDRERASFVDNSLKYESTLRFVSSGVRQLMDAMKSVNQS